MDIFLEEGEIENDLKHLNRCRLKWQALFLSDIVTAGGRQLERHMMSRPGTEERLSEYNFPQEEPTTGDWKA